MTKKIIILTDNYYPRAMAGGICAHKVAVGLREIGYDVHVVCLRRKGETKEDVYEGVRVHRIKNPIVYKIRDFSSEIANPIISKIVYTCAIVLNRALKILFLPWYPMMSPFQIRSYVNCAKKIDADSVVAEYFSIESMVAGDILRKKYGKKVVYYNVDSLSNIDAVTGIDLNFARRKGEKWERRFFRNASGVIVMKCHSEHYKRLFKNDYNISVSDLPLLDPVVETRDFADSDKEIWLYTGSLKDGYRSPRDLIKVFNGLGGSSELHFFSKGDCELFISEEAKKNTSIVQHGHVQRSELDYFYSRANVLISIGNAKGTFLPSKTIEYISQRKPIIHFSYQDDDASVPYLKEYGHSLIIEVNKEDLSEYYGKIKSFLSLEKGVEISANEVRRIFQMNTPVYTANIIDAFLCNQHKEMVICENDKFQK